MKATQLAIATAVVTCMTAWSGYALATQPGNNGGGNGGCGVGQQTNGCGSQTPGNGGAGGQGGNGTGIGLGVGIGHASSNSNSSANSVSGSYSSGGDANATGGNSNATGGAGGSASTNQAQSASGYGGTANGQGSGNATSVNVGGTLVERSAPAVAVGAQNAPVVDCRRTIGGGASSPGGSGVVSGFPLWKESDCEAVMGVRMMSDAPTGTFTIEDIRMVACRMEIVSTTPSCKAFLPQQQ